MANYRYKVCKGQKVVAVSTTLREAEAEAKRIGGIVLRVGVQNPPSKGYDTFLGGGAFSKAYARKPPVKKFRDQFGDEYDLDAGNQAVEAITKRGGMNDYSLYDAMKTAIVLARKKLAKAPEALKYLPEIVPVRLDNEPPDSLAYLRGEQGAREYVYAMPVYDQLRARMQTGEPLPRLATALYQLVNRTVTGRGSLREAARLFADEIANEERQGRLVSPVLEQVKAEEPHIVKVLNTLHNVIVGMGCGRIGTSYYGSDLHAGNFALKGDQLILLDPAACDLTQDELDELWYQNGWAKRPAVQNPAPAADQTKSAAFKAWFGNSKVVKRGKPLVVYHGTRDGGFTEFKLGKIDPHHNGFFFTSHKPTALSYSGSYDTPLPSKENLTFGTVAEFRRWLNDPANKDLASRFWFWEQAFDYEDEDGNPTGKQLRVWTVDFDNLPLYGPRGREFHRPQDLLRAVEQALANRRQIGLYGAYLSLQNPLVVDCKGADWNKIPSKQLEKAGAQAGGKGAFLKTYAITRIAKDLGYDGVIFKRVMDYGSGGGTEPGDVYVAFEPTQIKSATANRGTFSKTDADIRNPAPAADQTKSAAFNKWFGKSKVVDKNGKPLVVYHGTQRGGFTVFRPVDASFTYGYYFTDRKPVAESYSGSSSDPLASKSKQGIYRAYLSLQYPLEIDCHGSDWQSIPIQEVLDNLSEKEVLELEEALDHGAIKLPSDELLSTDKVCEIAQLLDYDGAILRNVVDYGPYKGVKERELGLAEPSDHFVAFESNQIKSADHNRGTFSRTDPDIRNPAERTWIPPATVAAEARKALELRAKQPPSNRCCTPVGIARAKQLANRQPVSETTLRRMKAYFDRHVVDRKGKGWGVDSKGYQAWLAWGGDSGRDWCKNILRGL